MSIFPYPEKQNQIHQKKFSMNFIFDSLSIAVSFIELTELSRKT